MLPDAQVLVDAVELVNPGRISPESAAPDESAPEEPKTARSRRDLGLSLLVGLAFFLIFNANMRSISAGDTLPARYLPFGILRDKSLSLGRFRTLSTQGQTRSAFWMVAGRDAQTISLYPIVLPVLITPLYLPAFAQLEARGWTELGLDRAAKVMEKLTASLLASAAVALLYLLMRRRARPRAALLLTAAFGLGTTTWVISSQALWQHGLGELLIVASLLLVTGTRSWPRVAALGITCGLIAGNRPPDAILAAALILYGLWWAGRRAPILVLGAALPSGLVLAYNLQFAGRVVGGYALMGTPAFFDHSLLPGLAGLLFSPTRGLFVFSPFLLAIPFCLPRLLRNREDRGLTATLGLAVILQTLVYAKADWRAGASYGPRYLTDLLPFLFWMLPPIVSSLTRFGRVLFALACGSAAAIQLIGAFWYTGASDAAIFAVHEDRSAAWKVSNAPFIAELRHGPAPADLGIKIEGFFDAIETPRGNVEVVLRGERADAAGWALAQGRSADRIDLHVDGAWQNSTAVFFDRPDVRSVLGQTSRAGWRVRIPTEDLALGEHVLTILVQAHALGESQYLQERRFRLLEAERPDAEAVAQKTPMPPPARAAKGDLEAASRNAASQLRERQEAAGAWLTFHTSVTRFENPQKELNTYLTAVLVDLLDPVAHGIGLDASLKRARQHLTQQIEPGGLVRYHGLPEAPTIGTLGCRITPDSDDTALVWRVAPRKPADSLSAALSVLDRYRTPEGLYRTWLAPRERYECLDPGADPNPADACIQMHILMLLARADPKAAHALCSALRGSISDSRIWVYYELAPLVPILRQADLRLAGCSLRLPASRIRTSVAGQEIWLDVCRRLELLLSSRGPSADAAEIETLLRALSEDGFALLKRSPPLIYHNDLSASVKRYYWSEEFGYAVWLRLYLENLSRARERETGIARTARRVGGA
ncbi:MAG: hypothetical protein ABIT01_01785 [Thermoanaerobaculia bacterium]